MSKQVQQFGKGFGGIQNLVGLSALGPKKLRLSPSKLKAPQDTETRLIEGFKSSLEIVQVFSEKLDLGERTFLNVEQVQNLKLDFDQIWQLSSESHSTFKSFMSKAYGVRQTIMDRED
jgi:hypothetical protein